MVHRVLACKGRGNSPSKSAGYGRQTHRNRSQWLGALAICEETITHPKKVCKPKMAYCIQQSRYSKAIDALFKKSFLGIKWFILTGSFKNK